MSSDANEAYFRDYKAIQAHKHALIQRYLQAWYPKLASWSGRVLYLETHAGRGVHRTGQAGSPLVAIQALLEHPQKGSIMNKCEFHFFLMELDPGNVQCLKEIVDSQPIPERIKIHVKECDFANSLRQELDRFESTGTKLAPAFVFIDPFGYQIPIDLVQRLMKHPSCEVMVNFMSQPVARAVGDPSKASHLDTLFGSDTWKEVKGTDDFEMRKERLTSLYSEAVGAKWTTKLRLTGQTDYTLMHFTNHDEGRATMKRSVWAVTERLGKGGIGQLLMKDNPGQGLLLAPEPDLSSLVEALKDSYEGAKFLYPEVKSWLLRQDFIETHLHVVLSQGRKEGWLKTDYKKPFGPAIGEVPMTIERSLF